MADTPDIDKVETEADYIRVRFRDPDRYDEIRTPDTAGQNGSYLDRVSTAVAVGDSVLGAIEYSLTFVR